MSQKIIGVGKAALVGAVFGGIIGIAALPRIPCLKKIYKSKRKCARKILRTIGIAMESMAEFIR